MRKRTLLLIIGGILLIIGICISSIQADKKNREFNNMMIDAIVEQDFETFENLVGKDARIYFTGVKRTYLLSDCREQMRENWENSNWELSKGGYQSSINAYLVSFANGGYFTVIAMNHFKDYIEITVGPATDTSYEVFGIIKSSEVENEIH